MYMCIYCNELSIPDYVKESKLTVVLYKDWWVTGNISVVSLLSIH